MFQPGDFDNPLSQARRQHLAAMQVLGDTDPASQQTQAALEAASAAQRLATTQTTNPQAQSLLTRARKMIDAGEQPEQKKDDKPKKSSLLSWWSERSTVEKIGLGLGVGAGLLGVGGIVGALVRGATGRK